ncbi:hypothetical protein V5K00_RS10215 [Enterobacter asburiae]
MIRGECILTLNEFFVIKRNLEAISDAWSDLWVMLYLTQIKPVQLLKIKFDDVQNSRIVFAATKGLKERYIALTPGVKNIILSRRKRYPEDVFLFQSHSNRTKATLRPVTLVAFNMALKRASTGVTTKTLTSKTANCLTLVK